MIELPKISNVLTFRQIERGRSEFWILMDLEEKEMRSLWTAAWPMELCRSAGAWSSSSPAMTGFTGRQKFPEMMSSCQNLPPNSHFLTAIFTRAFHKPGIPRRSFFHVTNPDLHVLSLCNGFL